MVNQKPVEHCIKDICTIKLYYVRTLKAYVDSTDTISSPVVAPDSVGLSYILLCVHMHAHVCMYAIKAS